MTEPIKWIRVTPKNYTRLILRAGNTAIDIMKTILVLSIMCAVAWGAPQASPASPIQRGNLLKVYSKAEDVILDDEGVFSVRFVDEDGTTVKEEGILVEDESTGAITVIVQKGYYSYINDDGVPVELVYDANNPGDIVMDQ